MKVLVLGGCGEVGIFGTKDLVKTEDVSKVIIGDYNIEKAKKTVAEIGSPKLSAKYIDINEHEGLVKAMKGADVVLNYAGPGYLLAVKVVKAAIEAGRHLVDVGDSFDPAVEALSLTDKAKKKGVTIIEGMGASPGLSNLLSKYGSDRLDKTDEINIYWVVGSGKQKGQPSGITPFI